MIFMGLLHFKAPNDRARTVGGILILFVLPDLPYAGKCKGQPIRGSDEQRLFLPFFSFPFIKTIGQDQAKRASLRLTPWRTKEPQNTDRTTVSKIFNKRL